MIARPNRNDWITLVVLGLMWGTSYAFIKLGVQTLPTFTLIATRLLIGFVSSRRSSRSRGSRCRGIRGSTCTSW